jgi:hypothetical protein
MSLLSVFGLSLALPLYVGAASCRTWRRRRCAGFALLLLASAVLAPLGLLARRLLRPPAADRLAWAGLLALGLFSSLLVLTVLRDVGLLLAMALGLFAPALAPTEAWIDGSAAAVPVLGLLVTALGLLNARRTAQVVTVDVPIAGLPAALNGFRIVQISDIHVGPTIKQPYLQAVVDAVNRLQPDVVAITGDLVDGSCRRARGARRAARRPAARYGSFFVTGNHEYYSGVQGWLQELRRLGVRGADQRARGDRSTTARSWCWPACPTGARSTSSPTMPTIPRPPCSAHRPARSRCCWRTSRAARPRRRRPGSSSSCPATPMAASSCPGMAGPAAAALYRRPAPTRGIMGLRQPRHRLLGSSEESGRSLRDYRRF